MLFRSYSVKATVITRIRLIPIEVYQIVVGPYARHRTAVDFGVFTMPIMRCRVVCALDVIIDRRSPTRSFIRVDFPTFGLPTILTNPALCPAGMALIFFSSIISEDYSKIEPSGRGDCSPAGIFRHGDFY